jgi:uncharacterized phiE125 gp8 family phage protein
MYAGIVGLTRSTAPTAEPVTVDWVEDQLNLSTTEPTLRRLIASARAAAERYMSRALITQSWTAVLDRWPGGDQSWWDAWHSVHTEPTDIYLPLPYPPLQSITNIYTYDQDDTETTITVDDYFVVDTTSAPGRLVLRFGQAWPVDTRRGNRIKIIYSAGYGASAENVPQEIREGLLHYIAYAFEHRGDDEVRLDPIRASGAANFYAPFRVMDL